MKIDYITPIREQLNERMDWHCTAFKLIGFPHETPRYFNLRSIGMRDEDYHIIIGSTQTSSLWFRIDLPEDYPFIDFEEFWSQFKAYRTRFLIEKHPTISPI